MQKVSVKPKNKKQFHGFGTLLNHLHTLYDKVGKKEETQTMNFVQFLLILYSKDQEKWSPAEMKSWSDNLHSSILQHNTSKSLRHTIIPPNFEHNLTRKAHKKVVNTNKYQTVRSDHTHEATSDIGEKSY